MSKNKRWKRRAKRMMGVSDLFCCDCFFCGLSRDMYRYGTECYGACRGHIRELERSIKEENLSKQNKLKL